MLLLTLNNSGYISEIYRAKCKWFSGHLTVSPQSFRLICGITPLSWMSYLPVWGAPWQDLSALLRVGHTVYRLLRILAFCYGGDLEHQSKEQDIHQHFMVNDLVLWLNKKTVKTLYCSSFTCTAWTCGDWITDGCAAWITPWTWTVCPLGSCTSVTVGPVAEACPAVIDT